MEIIYFTSPPVSASEHAQIEADGFAKCARYLEDEGLVTPLEE